QGHRHRDARAPAAERGARHLDEVSLTAVPYRPDRRADLFALMEAVWGERPDGEAFDWLFDRTPVRPGLVTLVEDEGEVAGVGALSWFRAKVDGVAQPVSAAGPAHVVRDADYLNWRFVDAPKEYRVLERDGGYAVVGHSIYHGVSAGYVADLVATGAREALGLLCAVVAEARGGADLVVAI